ncbi:hypothetical protein SDC9_212700 [bioreactor metagenome]|uniref:Uncharacterized protein n=1 Tax=bioreactor metagenome TaxID=1076179 RepID=A0A645JMR7_9ZZZZ
MLGQETVGIGFLRKDMYVIGLSQFGVELGQWHLAVLKNAWSDGRHALKSLELAGTESPGEKGLCGGWPAGNGLGAVPLFLAQSAVILRVWISCFQRSFSCA